MKRIRPVTFSFVYSDQDDSIVNLQTVYGRIFALARQRIIDNNSTQKYTKIHEDNKRPINSTARVSDDRRSGREVESHKGNSLQNGTQGQDSSNKVRQIVEDQQSAVGRITKGQGS